MDGATGAGAVVKSGAGKLRITVDDFAAGKIYTFVVKDGKKSFSSLDKVQEPDECATCAATVTNDVSDASQTETPAVKTVKKSPVLKGTDTGFPIADQKSVVDILVVFDQGAKAWAEKGSNWGNGGDSIEEFADYAVNKMNMVLEKSQLLDTFSYRLAGLTEVRDIGETPHFRFAFQRRFHSLSPLIAISPDFPLAFSRPLCDNLSVPRN